MKGTVTIGSVEVGMLATAASPILYKRVFHKDFFKALNSAQKDESEGVSLFEEMGFIMAMQDCKSVEELSKLTEDNYIEWLNQFGAEEMLLAVSDIAQIYRGQEVTNSAPKKEDG